MFLFCTHPSCNSCAKIPTNEFFSITCFFYVSKLYSLTQRPDVSPKHAQTGSLAKAADQPAQLEAAATALDGWCAVVESLLAEPEART